MQLLLAFIFLGAVLWAGFSAPLLRRLYAQLTVSEPPSHADVIALCGEGSSTAAIQAITLHDAGYADDFALVGDSETTERWRADLTQAGIDAKHVHVCAASDDPTQQSHALMLACGQYGWKRVLLVSATLYSRLMHEAIAPAAQAHGLRLWSTPPAMRSQPSASTLWRALWAWLRYS